MALTNQTDMSCLGGFSSGDVAMSSRAYAKRILIAALMILALLGCGTEPTRTYLEQGPFESSMAQYAVTYVEKYNILNQSSASLVRMNRRSDLETLTPHFINWRVRFLGAVTDREGEASVMFNALDHENVIYATGLSADSILYPDLSSLTPGDEVEIQGQFIDGDSTDGFKELSLTEFGSMTAPEFEIKLLSIRQAGF